MCFLQFIPRLIESRGTLRNRKKVTYEYDFSKLKCITKCNQSESRMQDSFSDLGSVEGMRHRVVDSVNFRYIDLE